MGETVSSGWFKKETTASKLIAFVASLFMLAESIALFMAVDAGTAEDIVILYGVIIMILAFYLFFSLDLIDLRQAAKFFLYGWWMLLIIGVLLIIFAFLAESTFFPATLVLIAFLIEFLLSKKEYSASKIVALIGAAFGIYDCFIIFLSGDLIESLGIEILYANAVFGLIFAIILILTLQNKIDIKLPYVWWFVALVGFFFYAWIYPSVYLILGPAMTDPTLVLYGISWIIIFLAFVLLAFGF